MPALAIEAKDVVVRVDPGRYMAMPLTMVHCKIRARPFARSLLWSNHRTLWQHVERAGEVLNSIDICDMVSGPDNSYR